MCQSIPVKYRHFCLICFLLWVFVPSSLARSLDVNDSGIVTSLRKDSVDRQPTAEAQYSLSVKLNELHSKTDHKKRSIHDHDDYQRQPMAEVSMAAAWDETKYFTSRLFEKYSNQSNVIPIIDLKILLKNIRLGSMYDVHVFQDSHGHEEYHVHKEDEHDHDGGSHGDHHDAHDDHKHGEDDDHQHNLDNDGHGVDGNSDHDDHGNDENENHQHNLSDEQDVYDHGDVGDHVHDKVDYDVRLPQLKSHGHQHDDDNHNSNHPDVLGKSKVTTSTKNQNSASTGKQTNKKKINIGRKKKKSKKNKKKKNNLQGKEMNAEDKGIIKSDDGQGRISNKKKIKQTPPTQGKSQQLTPKDAKKRNRRRTLQDNTAQKGHSQEGDVANDTADALWHVHNGQGSRNIHLNKCYSLSELLTLFNYSRKENLTRTEFIQLCPALISQIEAGNCERDVTDNHTHSDGHDVHKLRAKTWNINSIPGKVWGFSTLSVTIISLVGLLGVGIIPIMQKVFYNHLLQFLVALAVGALSGDALLHLLPHAITGGHGDVRTEHSHDGSADEGEGHMAHGLWQGLTALMGIYFFFLIERILTIVTSMKNKRKNEKKRTSAAYVTKEKRSGPAVGAKLSGHVETDCEEMVMVVHPNRDNDYQLDDCGVSALRQFAEESHKDVIKDCPHEHSEDEDEGAWESLSNSNLSDHHTNPARNHNEESGHGHHGHGHGHSHGPLPGSVAAVAWMVILGDGIHNFSDGLAIGAAFSNSLSGGLATSLAVFCHELPHEIGDFAVLLRAGMSVKQAVVYNCVSSVLCFIGMLIGVALGNISTTSLWIFAAVGGMFLYIALVDMLPEMTSVDTKHGENPFLHLLLQMCGMLLGASIMFVIALYEDDIRSSLDP